MESEPEGTAVPDGLELVDAHVHLFPPRVLAALWRWFDRHAWSVRYRLQAEEVVAFLRARGVKRFCGLHYSHKPGLAQVLNRFVAELARAHPEIIPLGTVLPGEPDARAVLAEALGPLGLRGIKIHCHVQRMAPDDPRLDQVYAACAAARVPVVIHSGREPSLAGYGFDTRALLAAGAVNRVLERYPSLRMIVPHLGMDEYEAYAALLDRHEHLYLDTTMAIAGFVPQAPPALLFPGRANRLLYGTDFPNIPYAWDRELRRALAAPLDAAERRALFCDNAYRLFLSGW
jgi:predicted TIM-barrel fold metal-dependent hydrolase